MARDCTAARTLTHRARSVSDSAKPPQQEQGEIAIRQPRTNQVSRVSAGLHIREQADGSSAKLVSRLHARLRDRIGAQRYAVWFEGVCQFALEPLVGGDADAHGVTVVSDGPFAQDLVRRGFRADIEAVVAEVCGGQQAVRFRLLGPEDARPQQGEAVEPEAVATAEQAPAERVGDAEPRVPSRAFPSRTAAEPARKRPLAKLDDFVTGSSNRMARAAAEMVVSRLGEISPLVIHGPSGTGKTHLLEGIVSTVREQHPGVSVMLVPAEQFTTSFLQALHGSGLPGFRRSYRSLDILLIDDLQFFAGKRATAVELQQTFDALRRQGRQVICACDRAPETLADLGQDLLGRLEGGMSVRLSPADFDVRRGIVAGLIDRRGLECEPAVLDYVAMHLTRNARELTGGVNRLEATSHMLGLPITLDLAEEALADLVRAGGRGVRLADIERAVCTAFGLEQGSLQSQKRARTVNHPRMLAMFLARKHTPAALTEIGSYFGRRSHSTVISARKTVAGWLASRARVQLADAAWDVEDAVRRVEELLRAS